MSESLKPDSDWSVARPEVIPRATSWPVGMAFGITLLMWGFITSIVLILVGATIVVVSLTGWIGEMRHEQTP